MNIIQQAIELLKLTGGPDIIPILVAASLGAILGLERELNGQAAGFRTTILISVAAALLMRLSFNLSDMFNNDPVLTAVRMDPARLAAYAMAGMGFLGAGAIAKSEGRVRGLTTASGLWLACAVGLACGAHMYVQAIMVALLALLVLMWPRLAPFYIKAHIRVTMTVKIKQGACSPDTIISYFECGNSKIQLTGTKIEDSVATMTFQNRGKVNLTMLQAGCNHLAEEEYVKYARWSILSA